MRVRSIASPHRVKTASTQWAQQHRFAFAQIPPAGPRASCLLVRGSNSSEVTRRLPEIWQDSSPILDTRVREVEDLGVGGIHRTVHRPTRTNTYSDAGGRRGIEIQTNARFMFMPGCLRRVIDCSVACILHAGMGRLLQKIPESLPRLM